MKPLIFIISLAILSIFGNSIYKSSQESVDNSPKQEVVEYETEDDCLTSFTVEYTFSCIFIVGIFFSLLGMLYVGDSYVIEKKYYIKKDCFGDDIVKCQCNMPKMFYVLCTTLAISIIGLCFQMVYLCSLY